MKIYEIYDEENEISVGTLLYYEKEKSFIIELQDYLDVWTAPLLFTRFVSEKQFTISRELSAVWVHERVIPSDRQNISSILLRHRLKEYDEMAFLEISEGRCSQDKMCIRKLTELPEYVQARALKNLTECMITEDNCLLCFFADGSIKKVNIAQLSKLEDLNRILNNRLVFQSAEVAAGGYALLFNDSIEISARMLYKEGQSIPLAVNDFIGFIQKNLMDTSDCCKALHCSRQNLYYLVKEDSLKPIKENVKGNLYLKGELLKNTW